MFSRPWLLAGLAHVCGEMLLKSWVLGLVLLSNAQELSDLYETISEEFLRPSNVDVKVLKHVTTDAEILLIHPRTETPEKAFAVSFRTPVHNSKGTPHILEHATLSGSTKYPIREPLFYLGRSSTATYLNAYTSAARTTYPFAVLHPQDLMNIASVYLDAVFDPLVLHDKRIFEREGWHLNLDSSDSLPFFEGVVYNEMKAVYSSPSNLFWRVMSQHVFPNTTMVHDSGGNPFVIPELSYSEFIDFYYKNYHPANAKVLYYGSEDVIPDLLKTVHSYLSFSLKRLRARGDYRTTEEVLESTKLVPQTPLSTPKYVNIRAPAKEGQVEDDVYFVMRLGPVTDDMCEGGVHFLLSSLILETPETPLYKLLLDKKVGKVIKNWGVETHVSEMFFIIGEGGVDPDRKPKDIDPATTETDLRRYYDKLIMDFFEKLSSEGFNNATVYASFNEWEFSTREASAKQENRGIKMFNQILDEWELDLDPVAPLRVDQTFECAKQKVLGDPDYLKKMLKKYYVNNQHRSVIRMVADPTLDQERQESEKRLLRSIKELLEPEELEQLVERTRSRKEELLTPDSLEALAMLPTLPLEVVSREAVVTDYNVTLTETEIPVVHVNLPTADIAHIEFEFDASNLTLQELLYLIKASYLFEYGDGKKQTAEERKVDRMMDTGGLHTGVDLSPPPASLVVRDPTQAQVSLNLRLKCLHEKINICIQRMMDQIEDVDFYKSKQILEARLKAQVSQLKNMWVSNPAAIGSQEWVRHTNMMGRLNSVLSGLESEPAWSRMHRMLEDDWESLAASLESVWRKVLVKQNLAVRIVMNEPQLSQDLPVLMKHITALPSGSDLESAYNISGLRPRPQKWKENVSFELPLVDNTRLGPCPSMVNYNYLGGWLTQPGDPVKPGDYVPATYFENEYMIPHLRYAGGAYGAHFRVDPLSGTYMFRTYRDPGIQRTFTTYREAPTGFRELLSTVDQNIINSGIISLVSKLDAPRSVVSRASSAFDDWKGNVTREYHQEFKEQLFEVNVTYFEDFVNRLEAAMEYGPKIAISVGRATVADFPGEVSVIEGARGDEGDLMASE
eukprot:Blabericola_migrator_1__11950@NODE_730_length_6703_cov_87_523357_g526_i0_p1_GENE_NODE_730_length_6703_cov_87_523357_g526_i0NODE_730_length_6703_cov_87_523357_g526_i0_p1_ORF_typecomplete_len1072_score192_01M16C_assoc/PF08367_11/3_5e26Peptidase_M16/PF00675_20/1_5e03Peptidase_M16/PF00675_20/3_8e14Peptidase_M16/PF00675_20/4_5e03Peptidase_M16_C/PF05193_21/0_029Peptidase_M16_C/PF05193_21/4_8e03Peptidase_M16_C/PF05193_21/5_8e02Peptidase_M16_C/PF05193_21/1_3e04_NODE_730_length_6703_cov_87_523357_g526_i0